MSTATIHAIRSARSGSSSSSRSEPVQADLFARQSAAIPESKLSPTLMAIVIDTAEFHGLRAVGAIALIQFAERVADYKLPALEAMHRTLREWCSATPYNVARVELLEILIATQRTVDFIFNNPDQGDVL